jgi:tetratricopeptide (TPR) repeat protein
LSNFERHVEALADIDEALRMAASPQLTLSNESIADAHFIRGKILLQTQRSDEALSELDQALSLIPDSELSLISEIACHRAQAFHNLGRFTEAVHEVNRVFEHGEKAWKDWAASMLAWQLATCPDLTVRDIPRALELARQAVEREPNNGNHWNTLGVAQYRAADLTAAIESLTKSLKLGDSSQAVNLLFLAMAHSQLGQPDQAREWYAKALRWMTDNKSTEKELLRHQAEAKVALGIAPDTPVPKTGEGQVLESTVRLEKETRADALAGSNDP